MNSASEWELFFDFYLGQWGVLKNFRTKLHEELKRYSEQLKDAQTKDLLFQPGSISLEKLPIIMLALEEEPHYANRLIFYDGKQKCNALKEIEDFLSILGLEPLPRTQEIAEIISKWELE